MIKCVKDVLVTSNNVESKCMDLFLPYFGFCCDKICFYIKAVNFSSVDKMNVFYGRKPIKKFQ